MTNFEIRKIYSGFVFGSEFRTNPEQIQKGNIPLDPELFLIQDKNIVLDPELFWIQRGKIVLDSGRPGSRTILITVGGKRK
jgi:hypothetical protein